MFSDICFLLFSESEVVVLFTLEVMVKSCNLCAQGAKRRAAEPESAMGHISTGGMLWGVHMFQEGLDSTALKL